MAGLSEAEVLERVAGRDQVCTACAEHHAAEWPSGHEATFWIGPCGFCGAKKAVCCTSDWNWPRLNKQAQRKVRADREI